MADKTDINTKRMRVCDEDVWRTISGAKVLVGEDGTIKGGAGGKFNGRKFGAKPLAHGSKGQTTGTIKKTATSQLAQLANWNNEDLRKSWEKNHETNPGKYSDDHQVAKEAMGSYALAWGNKMNKLSQIEKSANSPAMKEKGAAVLASLAQSLKHEKQGSQVSSSAVPKDYETDRVYKNQVNPKTGIPDDYNKLSEEARNYVDGSDEGAKEEVAHGDFDTYAAAIEDRVEEVEHNWKNGFMPRHKYINAMVALNYLKNRNIK